jgi:hypothetical protein
MFDKNIRVNHSSQQFNSQEVNVTNIEEAAGNISKSSNVSRFIMIDQNSKSFASLNSRAPYYVETVTTSSMFDDAPYHHRPDMTFKRKRFTVTTNHVNVEVLNILVVGKLITFEVVEKDVTSVDTDSVYPSSSRYSKMLEGTAII